MAGVDALGVEADIADVHADDGRTDAKLTSVCIKCTAVPSGKTSCAVSLEGDE